MGGCALCEKGYVAMKKITVFVFRNNRKELLLFEHEDKTVQLPAGTVEINEGLLKAGIREACEETAISQDSIIAGELLDFSNNDLENDELVIEKTSPVFSRPKETSMNWGKIPRGITVKQVQESGGFYQVYYDDWNDEIKKDYLTYSLLGWIKKEHASKEKLRYYCVLDVKNEQEEWLVNNDNHEFKPFWSPITNLPKNIVPENKWINILRAYLKKNSTTKVVT